LRIFQDSYDELVGKTRGAVDDIQVAIRERVKGSGVEGAFFFPSKGSFGRLIYN